MYDTKLSVGQERLKSDKRQLGGMILLLASCALVFPMANLATRVGPDGTTDNEGIPLSSLIASVFVITLGMIGLLTGYLQAVHDFGNLALTGFLLLFNQLAWMPFITDLVAVGKAAASGEAFFPPEYDASPSDVKFVGAMGMMGILGYGTGFLGSLAFVGFALYSFQAGKPGDRPGSYYAGRLNFYGFALFLVGLAQLLLGTYLLTKFSAGPLPYGPVGVAMFVVNFPEISIVCGAFHILIALYGFLARSIGILNSEDNHSYQVAVFAGWVCTVSMQILVQVGYNPGGVMAAAAPSQTMLTLGIFVINAFLDFKRRTTPNQVPMNYYTEGDSNEGSSMTAEKTFEKDEMEHEE
mmetsp:Transcript_12413/g.21734  ORF Transcript_12413/g.21734 Transcript_12413/m.21734 type:complete len:353 (-) Transcript_12413:221-1279(-)